MYNNVKNRGSDNMNFVKKLLIGFGTLAVISLIIGFAVSNASAKAEVKAREAAQVQQQVKDTADVALKVKQAEQDKVVADAKVVADTVAVSAEDAKVVKANGTNAIQVPIANQNKTTSSNPAPVVPAQVAPKSVAPKPVVKAAPAPAPDMSGQIASMRRQKLQMGPGITINGRILNLTIELQIHKLRSESESTFKSMVQGMMFQESSGTLTLKARQFNSIANQAIYGSISDDSAISQLQALSQS